MFSIKCFEINLKSVLKRRLFLDLEFEIIGTKEMDANLTNVPFMGKIYLRKKYQYRNDD